MNSVRSAKAFTGTVALAVAVILASGLLSTADAQTPNQQSCAPPFSRGPGGQTVTAGKIQVTLPAGYNYLWNVPAPGSSGGTLRICIIEYFSQIELNSDTGAETSRLVAVGSASAVLDLIVSSARLTTPPTPTPAPVQPLAVQGSGVSRGTGSITPPNTGDGGLR